VQHTQGFDKPAKEEKWMITCTGNFPFGHLIPILAVKNMQWSEDRRKKVLFLSFEMIWRSSVQERSVLVFTFHAFSCLEAQSR